MNKDEFTDRILRRSEELIQATHELQAAIQFLRNNPSRDTYPQTFYPAITPLSAPTTTEASSQTEITVTTTATSPIVTTTSSTSSRTSVIDTLSFSRGQVTFRPLRRPASSSSESSGEDTAAEDNDH